MKPRDILLSARTLFTQVVTNYPNTEEAKLSQLRVGFCSYKLGDLPTAIQSLTAYISFNETPDNPLIDDAKLQLGLSYKLSDMSTDAENWIKAVIAYKTSHSCPIKIGTKKNIQ